MRPGTREAVVGAELVIIGRDFEARVTTDADGRFRLTGLDGGDYQVTPASMIEIGPLALRASGTRRVRLHPGELPPDLELWLPERSSLSGRVRGPDGQPLADSYVALWRLGWDGHPTLVPGSSSTRTDADGRYELTTPPGEYYVEISDASGAAYPRYYYPGSSAGLRPIPRVDPPR